jgi:hypothetical protein
MPIEIRELVIKAVVANETESGGNDSASGSAEDAVQISLEQISEIKRKEKER